MFWPLLESNNTYNDEKNYLGTLCEQIFWPVLPKQQFAITQCFFIWKAGISLTGIIRKHFFKHNCQCHLKRFTKFSKNLSVLHWTREQWQIKKLNGMKMSNLFSLS